MKKKSPLVIACFIGLLLLGCAWFFYKSPERPHLTVIGFVNMADGLGRQSAELIDTLKDDMTVNFVPTQKTKSRDLPEKIYKIVKKKNKTLGKVIIFEDMLWHPGHNSYLKTLKTPRRDDQIRIAYSMIESTRIPSEWVVILNKYFDAVAVPDPFLIAAYRDSGVKIPIFELPLGLDLGPFLNAPLKSNIKKPFVFANLSSCVDRKNHIVLIKAFAKAFGNNKDVQLVINSRFGDRGMKKSVKDLIDDVNTGNIIVASTCLDKNAYLYLFQTIDCYVSLSKAEGFSIQPREAMALGIPTIVTDNTGQSTICKSGLVKRVSSTIEEPAVFFWGDKNGSIFNCEVDEAAAALREVYENYSQYLQHAASARDWVRRYEFKNLKPFYHTLAKPKRVILGNEDKIGPDYLMTTSKELYEKYERLVLTHTASQK